MRRYKYNDEAHLIGWILGVLRITARCVRYLWVTRQLGGRYSAAWRYFWSAHGRIPPEKANYSFHLKNVSLTARPQDWCAFDEVICRDEYGFVDFILAKHSQPTVLDLGANIGLFAARVLSARPNATVISLEPSETTFRVLQKNCAQNRHYRWRAIRGALWSDSGIVSFEETLHSTGSYVSPGGTTTVPAMTLVQLMREHAPSWISLAKMDIEGAEEVVLMGNERCLHRFGCLIVEIHPNRCSAARVISILRNHFRYLHTVPGRLSSKPLIVAARQRYPLPLMTA